ncbi:hypothetical protein ACFB49_07210 [Sphingomonas sp. DBB INV C78]|uniref:hypothetical protein n=1 Tax=Sphingomonas sp. DBB INV C78 TaxID=3349434 RepID=UPI0036D20D10
MKFLALLLAAALVTPAAAQAAEPPKSFPKTLVEIYRIVPGQHEAFLRYVAKLDAVNAEAGLPPRQLYVHSDGEGWDFMLIQPAETPKDKQAALDKAWEKAGLPSGADFFFEFRQFIADHSDTFAKGPITAADFLATSKAK